MLRREVAIDDARAELDTPARAGRHAPAAVARDVHEQPLDAFGSDVDIERRGRVAQADLDVAAYHVLENRLEIANQRIQIDEHGCPRLFFAGGGEFTQEAG